MKKNKQLIRIIGAVVILAGALVWSLQQKEQTATLPDADRFATEYTKVADDHRFKYATDKEILDIFDGGTGVVYLGFPECPWCQAVTPILDEAAKAEGIDTINYLNVRQARTDNDATHQALMEHLSEYLNKDEDGNPRLYVPDISIVRNGEIIGRYEQESIEGVRTPDEYWTAERRAKAVTELREMMQLI